jgi:hypothetical protein
MTKNFQQTPKQRRANLERAKRELRHSNPKRQFRQEHAYSWWGWTVKNITSYRGHKQ